LADALRFLHLFIISNLPVIFGHSVLFLLLLVLL